MSSPRTGLVTLFVMNLLCACGGEEGDGSGPYGITTAASSAPTLDQTNNPVYAELNSYKSWLSTSTNAATALAADTTKANNIVSWQMPHGGFYKIPSWYSSAWNGKAARSEWLGANGVELGTIDNGATVSEILFLADVYKRGGKTNHRDAARRALDFLLTMQSSSGGWPQVYPARTGTSYSNYITFNDNAMVRVLVLLDHASRQKAPLDGDIFTAEQRAKLAPAIDKGVNYILKAQIVQGGVKTVWCAQHDPASYAPKGARAYELPSRSGSESVGIVAFLMTRPQTAEVKAAVQAAIAWFKRSTVKVANTAYVKRPSGNTDDSYNPIQTRSGSTMWYRFYDLNQDKGFFSDRTGGMFYNIMDIEAERRYGYQWGGDYGTRLIKYSDSVGY
ncbi:pectate lyase [Cystobacter fuscus]|uniref:pectate lyase n=1 Tax=Cystobacter fuscus TaxID=43 RepID=UPI002B2E8D19|nr:pectate lyase [Cystobacter fuscus]